MKNVDNKEVWVLKLACKPNNTNPKKDIIYLKEGYIVITPMSIDENNPQLMTRLLDQKETIPSFSIRN